MYSEYPYSQHDLVASCCGPNPFDAVIDQDMLLPAHALDRFVL